MKLANLVNMKEKITLIAGKCKVQFRNNIHCDILNHFPDFLNNSYSNPRSYYRHEKLCSTNLLQSYKD